MLAVIAAEVAEEGEALRSCFEADGDGSLCCSEIYGRGNGMSARIKHISGEIGERGRRYPPDGGSA